MNPEGVVTRKRAAQAGLVPDSHNPDLHYGGGDDERNESTTTTRTKQNGVMQNNPNIPQVPDHQCSSHSRQSQSHPNPRDGF